MIKRVGRHDAARPRSGTKPHVPIDSDTTHLKVRQGADESLVLGIDIATLQWQHDRLFRDDLGHLGSQHGRRSYLKVGVDAPFNQRADGVRESDTRHHLTPEVVRVDRINRLARDRRDDRKLGLVERRGLGDAHELIAHWRHHWAVESVAHLEAAGPHPLSRELIDNGSHRIIRSG